MKSLLTSAFVFVGVASLVLTAGCQSSAGPSAGKIASTQKAVTCEKCKVTWVQVPNSGGKHGQMVTIYTTQKRMECPECKSAVDNFVRTGKLQHTCSICGDALQVCESH